MAARLARGQADYAIRARNRGERAADVAMRPGVTARHVRRLWEGYRRTGRARVQRSPGRPGKGPTASLVRAVLSEHDMYGYGARQITRQLRGKRDMSYHAAYMIMRKNGRTEPSEARSRKRARVRYERKYSCALWHVDWHIARDPRFSGTSLVAHLDDSSRCVVGARLFERATSENAVIAMSLAIAAFGKPAAILSDNALCFVGRGGRLDDPGARRKATAFQEDLLRRGTRQTAPRPYRPQTNGRPERFLRSPEREIPYHDGLPEYVTHYNEYRLHGSPDWRSMETPLKAFVSRKATPAIRKKNPGWADEDTGDGRT